MMRNELLVNKKVLIVEDDDACRMLLEQILENIGCPYDVALNGQHAVDKVKHGAYDLVFMDLRMPVLNGYEAAKAMREARGQMPIIALTAHTMEWVEGKCLSYGMNDYLAKPFDAGQLEQVLLKWITHKK